LKTINYKIVSDHASSKLLQVTVSFPTNESETLIHLPAWRPGRYELGNFAKNVKNFSVFDDAKKKCVFFKTNKDTWLVKTEHTKSITVQYNYYANELNAGSTFVDTELIYVNPVNCLVYIDALIDHPISISVANKFNWQIATSLKNIDGVLHATNYDELVDSPFIVSPNLQLESYTLNSIVFTIWINGHKRIDWQPIINDFKKFTQHQLEAFGEFPADKYEFLIFSLPNQAYHGVEHLKSTVITLGPSHALFNSLYNELLGVSSHELYHAWNIKSIRPAEMLPYHLKVENYSTLGYIYEGITTYMGDLFLLKSGVFNLETYLVQFSQQVQKHLDNPGRFNYSVAESSHDTWLDGYVSGVPGRKVSIYTEGCLLAFCADILIRQATKNKHGLDEVMKRLYFDFALNGLGITEKDYQNLLENISGISFQSLFDDYVNGTHNYESILIDCLEYVGLSLQQNKLASYSQSRLGLRFTKSNNGIIVSEIYPGSPADIAGICLNDQVIALNEIQINNDFDALLDYMEFDEKKLILLRNKKILYVTLPEVNRYFYQKHSVIIQSKLSPNQQKALAHWGKEGVNN
jgi:predicted metalloprotease with PDZ domain